VRVKRLFAGEQESLRHRMEIIARAKVLDGCAVSIAKPCSGEDMRLLCSQAADELLNLADVDAAFVLFAESGKISISARSYGARNVQVIMEQLGGGGHQTMAAAQLPMDQCTMEDAVHRLADAIHVQK
jgi:c-di-AMP phosphodiesterase-like protein